MATDRPAPGRALPASALNLYDPADGVVYRRPRVWLRDINQGVEVIDLGLDYARDLPVPPA